MKLKELQDMNLHETREIGGRRSVLRVVGGWVYFDHFKLEAACCAFVPETERTQRNVTVINGKRFENDLRNTMVACTAHSVVCIQRHHTF